MAKGVSLKTSERGSMMSFPYDTSEKNRQMGHPANRLLSETLEFAKTAEEKSKSECGVKGFSILYHIPSFDIIRGVTVDYMHCVLLGVQKMLFHHWTDNCHKNEQYYIGDFVNIIDDRIRELSPPNLLTRVPRSIAELKNWKASEFRSFLLYFSVPCLIGILSDAHFAHYMLFVEGIFLLLKSSISPSDLFKAKGLLAKFCAEIDYMYQPRCETSNVHGLLHMAEKVEDLGPLWSHSCFFYEDLNGDLRSLFHGTQKVELQISSAVVVHQQFPLLLKSIPKGSEADILYCSMKKKLPLQNRMLIKDNIFAVGKLTYCDLSNEIRQLVEEQFGPVGSERKFFRLQNRGIVYHSKGYKKESRRNSYSVLYVKDGRQSFGSIQYYLEVCSLLLSKTRYIAVLKQMDKKEKLDALPPHVALVEQLNSVIVVPVENILEMCVYMRNKHSEEMFIARLPNAYEKD